MVKNEFEHYTQFCGPCIGTPENENLSNAQKELLLWHWRWGIIMHSIQEMMEPQRMEEPNGSKSVMAPIIHPKTCYCSKLCIASLRIMFVG